MAPCQAVTSAGRSCSFRARDGHATCGRHKAVVVGAAPEVVLCSETKVDGTRCTKPCVAGDTICKLHRTVNRRRLMERMEVELYGLVVGVLFLQHERLVTSVDELIGPVEAAWQNGLLYPESYARLLNAIERDWAWYQEMRVPTFKATTELQRFAMDNQNVHTQVVVAQTTDGMKFLLETPVPPEQDVIKELRAVWDCKGKKRVMRDVDMWYNIATCVEDNDYLYKRMLDGLWARIKTHKEREELTKRLWEEASDSVGKCCQGHLSRLTNVLVGFTDEVKAEVPVGELLQQKIAAIAAQDIRVEEKVAAAWAVFEELKIPMEQRDAWIDAF